MSVHTHALERSLAAMTFGAVKSYDDLQKQMAYAGLGELDQQFQVPVAGDAGPTASWGTLTVTFSAPLVEASQERRSSYSDPLFTFGAVVSSGGPVCLYASVRRWVTDTWLYTGAELDVCVFRPGAADTVPFKGELHLNFQGYGTPDPDDGGDDEQ